MAVSISAARTSYPSSVVVALAGRVNHRRRCTVETSFGHSSSQAASTRKPSTLRIGEQWAELQGARDWDGLLSPLDGALRGELVRYGEFVRAAYVSFEFGGGRAPTSYGSCRFPSRSLLRRSGIPETGYEVTRLLHAAASSAPSWLPACSSSYIGFVAVCDDEDEIERLGRRDVVIAYRGTVTCSEWLDNLQSTLTRLSSTTAARSSSVDGAAGEEEEPMVESGFWRLFTTPGKAHSSLQQQVRGEVQRIVRQYGGRGMPPLSITVTGHSLGAALAVLTAHEVATAGVAASITRQDGAAAPVVTAVSFGGPRVGNAAFRRRLEESGGKVLRVVNSNDIVTKVPGFPVDVRDDDCCGGTPGDDGSSAKRLPRWLASKMGWAYSDVGRELRLCCQGSAPNVVASHNLDLYLKLVAGDKSTLPSQLLPKSELSP